jgi:hypothetical protein
VRKIPRLPLAVLLLMLLLRLPIPSSWADLAATPGVGALIAYNLVGGANYVATMLCDSVVGETRCATITAANAVKVDGSAVTQPVSQATAANLNATARVQDSAGNGITSTGGSLNVDVQAGLLSVTPSSNNAWGLGSSTQNSSAPTTGQLALGQFNTTPTTITSGNISPFQLDTNGNLLVNVKAGGAGGGAITAAAGSYAASALSVGAAVDGWDITQGTKADAAWTSGSGSQIAILKSIATNVSAPIPTGTNVIGGVFGSPNVTPTDCSVAITTGGTAQNLPNLGLATIHGVTIANIDAAAGSGEPVWISLTTTAAAATIASYPLAPPAATTFAGNGSYSTPMGFGVNHAISVVAATTGHKISCTAW